MNAMRNTEQLQQSFDCYDNNKFCTDTNNKQLVVNVVLIEGCYVIYHCHRARKPFFFENL